MKFCAGKYKLVLMHWPRLYSVLERFVGIQETKQLPTITVSCAFPFLLSLAGDQLQNNKKYCTLQTDFLSVMTQLQRAGHQEKSPKQSVSLPHLSC